MEVKITMKSKTCIVAVRNIGCFEFPTRKNALDFIKAIEKLGYEWAISV